MNLNEFKQQCAEENLRKQESFFLKRHKKLLQEQKRYHDSCFRPRGLFGNKCPVCGKKLKKIQDGSSEYIVECPCGYEYAGTDDIVCPSGGLL